MSISPKLSAATLFAATFLALTGCRKEKASEDTGYATEHATLEKTFSDVQSIADEAGSTGSLSNYRIVGSATVLSNCASVINDTTVSPHVLTVDFGAANCLCADGIYRRGKIIISYTGRYRDAGHTHTITFDSYYVNDNEVSGTKTVTNSGADASGNPRYEITVAGSIALANGNGTISWNSSRTRTWLSGYSTPAWKDDT
jgi:hypothetical protein